jgi:hypothetical protein
MFSSGYIPSFDALQIMPGLDFFDWVKVEIRNIFAAKYEKATYILLITGG